MIKNEILFIRDFIIIRGLMYTDYLPLDFYKSLIGKNTLLLYQKSDVHTHCTLTLYEEKFEIQCENSFYPLFHYKNEVTEIITPNYSHLYNFHISLTNNTVGIKEFILFNTALTQHTFHNEVKRLIGIEKIILENDEIKFLYRTDVNVKDSIENIFEKEVERISELSKAYHHAVFLSGGSESRINAAISKHYKFNKEFITWGHPEDKEYIIASQIAEKLNTIIHNIRISPNEIPYTELLAKTGFLANMQHAYRYGIVKQLFEKYKYDVLWTGWGDITGYPTMYQSSELFSDYYLGLYNGVRKYPAGWNKEWLEDCGHQGNIITERIRLNPNKKTFFELKDEIFAPYIFGQVLSIENSMGYVYAPWFVSEIYSAIKYEEEQNESIVKHKIWRTLWKNELYFQLVKKYCPKLNYIKNSKGYYPFIARNRFGLPGLFWAAGLKELESKKNYPFDPVEDKKFINEELERIIEENIEIFDKEAVCKIIKNIIHWKGNEIHEYAKMIQINWFLNK